MNAFMSFELNFAVKVVAELGHTVTPIPALCRRPKSRSRNPPFLRFTGIIPIHGFPRERNAERVQHLLVAFRPQLHRVSINARHGWLRCTGSQRCRFGVFSRNVRLIVGGRLEALRPPVCRSATRKKATGLLQSIGTATVFESVSFDDKFAPQVELPPWCAI